MYTIQEVCEKTGLSAHNILFQSSFNDSINYSSLYVKYM